MLAAILSGVFTAFTTIKLARYFGGGDLTAGFVAVASLFAIISLFVMMVVFKLTSETREKDIAQIRLSAADTMNFLRYNTAFWVLFIAIFVGTLANSIAQKSLVYYVSYYVGDPAAITAVLPALLAGGALSVPFWTFAARRFSKRDVWLFAGAASVLIGVTQLIIAPRSVDVLLPFQVIHGIFAAGPVIVLWSMIPDTVEFGEWHSGIRDEGITFGLNQLALKAASGLGVGFLGLALAAIGYEAGTEQSERTLMGLRVILFGIPAGFGAIALLTIFFYPIDRRLHGRLVKALARKSR